MKIQEIRFINLKLKEIKKIFRENTWRKFKLCQVRC